MAEKKPKSRERGYTEDGSRWKRGKTPAGKKFVAYRGADGTKTVSVVHGKDGLGYIDVSKKYTSGKMSTGAKVKGMKYHEKVHPVTGRKK